jgi:hypothetical protein
VALFFQYKTIFNAVRRQTFRFIILRDKLITKDTYYPRMSIMHTNTRKLDERSPQRLSSMKSAKETKSPIHSQRTQAELENRMSSNSVLNILGLNVEETLMRMDDSENEFNDSD